MKRTPLKPAPPASDERRRRFERVYEANHGPVLGYVLRRTGSPDDAADVIAETFLTARIRLHRARRRIAAELARDKARPRPGPAPASEGDPA